MTETEVLTWQEANGNREFLLIKVGMFLNAYGHGAFALHRVTGYTVKRKHRKAGDILTAGFQIDTIGKVCQKITDMGGRWQEVDDKTWRFSGIDGTPDSDIVVESIPQKKTVVTASVPESPSYEWLADRIRHFNLSASTPMDAMLFVSELQKQLS